MKKAKLEGDFLMDGRRFVGPIPLRVSLCVALFIFVICGTAIARIGAKDLVTRAVAPQWAVEEDAVLRRGTKTYSKQNENICTTEACYRWAKFLKNALPKNYTEVDPCTDFATWACGGWKDHHQLGPDQSQISTLSDIQDENNNILRRVIESPYKNKGYPGIGPYTGNNATDDQENFGKMKAAYDACMDEQQIKKQGIKPLVDLVSQLPGPEEYGTTEGLTKALAWTERQGASGLVDLYTGPDSKHPDVVVIWITSGTYMLPSKEYYDDDETINRYAKAISGMFAEILGGESRDHDEIAKKVIDLEAQIARAEPSPDVADSVTYNYNPISLSDADNLVPNISFTQLIKAFAPKGYTTDTVINDSPDFFPKLASAMKNTTADVIHAYLQWELIQTWAYRVHGDFRKPLKTFNNWLNGYDPDATSARWADCLDEVDSNLPWIESDFFIRYHFNDKAKRIGEEMTKELKEVFKGRLEKYDWMGEAAKQKAKEKVENMVAMIGYPTKSPNVLDPGNLKQYYARVNVTNASYWDNGIAFNRFTLEAAWDDLLQPTDRSEWWDTVPTVTGYYTPWKNELVITAGSMQFPWLDAGLPDHINYGGTAAGTIGHEMTHGFDSDGREYDERGAYRNWWDERTRAAFDRRARCLVDQFSNYTVPGTDGETIRVNGRQTLTENIADTGGVSLGYEAWRRRAERGEGDNRLLPGLEDFSPARLFFLAYASNYCYQVRPQQMVEWTRTDVHAPVDYRIIGPMANSRGFREAFDCPVKEPTCELW
ncbi:putative endothelin-converting enzyme protein [Neofusicoccum parvum]|nr:putative endothelin-converting enzyme protein [Neofusicoccum parvum]